MVKLLRPVLGAYKLRELSARQALDGLRKIAETHATRTVEIAHNTLQRAITLAVAEDRVGRNVALVVKTRPGRSRGSSARRSAWRRCSPSCRPRKAGGTWTPKSRSASQPAPAPTRSGACTGSR